MEIVFTIVGTISGFVFLYFEQGYVESFDFLGIIFLSTVLGLFGFMFYPHKSSYNWTLIFGGIGAILWFFVTDSLPLSLWFGLVSGFILISITSRMLHAMNRF